MFKYSNGEESEILKPSKDIIKWTNGDKCEKSFRRIENKEEEINKEESDISNTDTNTNFYQDDRFIQQGFVLKQNKRDSFNDKLLERGFQTQLSQNPFLAGGNYISDIEVEDNFLRPKNTNTIHLDDER